MSKYDETHLAEILAGEGTWFSAHLLRLIGKADKDNRAKLALGFPKEVKALEKYRGEA
tara:strand:- start:114 stop:287 length:174 start_codon:yes stop_codon:yes gene_type:complete